MTEQQAPGHEARLNLQSIALLVATTFAVAVFVHLTLSSATDDLLRRNADTTSRSWAKYFNANIPDIGAIYATGELTDAQRSVIADTHLFGEVFRFKLITLDGRLLIISDDRNFVAETHDSYAEAAISIAGGASIITLEDGTEKADRPDIYAEAYVPAFHPDGRLIGVMEIYTDQAAMAATLEEGFRPLRFILPMLAALVYLLPSLGLLFMSRQRRHNAIRLAAAQIDPLTGAIMRGPFHEQAQAMFERCSGDGKQLAVMFFDVDRFKQVNDTIGHAGGDAYLAEIATRIRDSIRAEDILGRVGGDEFVLVLPNVGIDGLRERAAQIGGLAARTMSIDGQGFAGSVSIGAVLSRADDPDFAAALARADEALYAAKAKGRGCAVVRADASGAADEIVLPHAA